jgi:adenylate cyclase
MSKRARNFFKNLRFNAIAWFIAGNLFVFFRFYGTFDEKFLPVSLSSLGYSFIQGTIVSLINGILITVIDFLIDTEKYKRRSFRYTIIAKSSAYSLSMFVCIFLIAITDSFLPNDAGNNNNGLAISIRQALALQYALVVFVYGMSINLLINLIKEAAKKFGPGVMLKLFSGRYYHPKVEEKIFMFIDLKSSTAIAEKLGHIKYSNLIQDCFYDVTDVVDKYKAEIYQYVGDEIVLTWDMEKGIDNDNCLYFYFEFQKKIERKSKYYRSKYDVIPEFKASINCGSVTVSEIGEIKKDIAYHGDVLNTASRIQDQCNIYDKQFLISEEMRRVMPRNDAFKIDLLGKITLKGKVNPLEIYSVEMANGRI